jgi:thiazole tautomerase (transcriptional regulator TenI)
MTDTSMQDFPIIHAVTDSGAVLRTGFVDRATSVMKALGARGALHLRSSQATGSQFHKIADALRVVQESTGCWLIVNDRVDVALAVKSRGAQLASHSLSVADALVVAGGIPLGASIHSVEEALEAEAEGASWCVAGTVFETPSHVGREPARVEFVHEVCTAVKIPVIAIGGIMPEDVHELLRAGAHGIATIRGAGWDQGLEASADGQKVRETRLVMPYDAEFPEPITRYISAYDSGAGPERNHLTDGERHTPGADAE